MKRMVQFITITEFECDRGDLTEAQLISAGEETLAGMFNERDGCSLRVRRATDHDLTQFDIWEDDGSRDFCPPNIDGQSPPEREESGS